MQETWERARANGDSILATVAGILAIIALIIAIAGTTGVTREEAQEMVDDAVVRVADPAGYTQRMVQEAIDRYDAEGREASIAYHQSTESIDGPWYVFLLDENGFVDSQSRSPGLRGHHASRPVGYHRQALRARGRGGG